MLFADFFDTSYLISMITKTIDLLVVIVIGFSTLQTMLLPIGNMTKRYRRTKGNNFTIKNYIKSLLLALELESANAILKMGVFTSNITNADFYVSDNLDNFIFFVAVLSVRIIINQSLRLEQQRSRK